MAGAGINGRKRGGEPTMGESRFACPPSTAAAARDEEGGIRGRTGDGNAGGVSDLCQLAGDEGGDKGRLSTPERTKG